MGTRNARLRLQGSTALLLLGLTTTSVAAWAQEAAAPAAAPPAAADPAELATLQDTVRTLTTAINGLQQQLQAKSQEAAQSAAQLAAANGAKDQAAAQGAERLAAATKDVADKQARITALEAELASARAAVAGPTAQVGELQGKLEAATAEVEAAAGRAKALEADVAAGRADAAGKAEELATLTTQAESVAATAAALQLQLRDADTTLKQAQAKVAEQDAQLTTMRADLVAARNDLGSAEAQLAGKVKENEMLAAAGRDLVAGGESLAAELAALKQQTVGLQQELTQAREVALSSETRNQALEQELGAVVAPRALFFTRLREALGPDNGVLVEDDRLVFPPDVTFASASAKLTPAARTRVLEIGRAVAAAGAALPDDLNWVIRIDGHTDRSTVGHRVFDSNRELAAERAVEVVQLLAKAGVPPDRLAAASFGEFRPLDPGDTAEAYKRNRRIELVLDEG